MFNVVVDDNEYYQCSSSETKLLFLKNPENRLPLNVWSGTDYSKNTDGFRAWSGVEIKSSSDYSVIGLRSLKATVVGNKNKWVDVEVPVSLISGTRLKSTVKIKYKHGGFGFFIIEENASGEQKSSGVNLSSSDSFQKAEVTYTLTDDAVLLKLRIILSGEGEAYLDNWELFKL